MELPTIECKGECAVYCTSVVISRGELQRLRNAAGKRIRARPCGPKHVVMNDRKGRCPVLTKHGMCGLYEDRPMICRLYGLTEDLPCQFGCVPKPRYLTKAEGAAMLRRGWKGVRA